MTTAFRGSSLRKLLNLRRGARIGAAVTAFHPGSLIGRRLRYYLPLHFFTLPRLRRKNADLPSTVVPYRAMTGVSSAPIAVIAVTKAGGLRETESK